MECFNEQPISQYCAFCEDIETGEKLKMAEYYCDICHLFSSDPKKHIFHCTGCNMCRAGKREDWTHCKDCDTCIFAGAFSKHKCQKGAFKSKFIIVILQRSMPCMFRGYVFICKASYSFIMRSLHA